MYLRTVKNLFCVPKCVGCNERLSPIASKEKFYGNVILCPSCEGKWNLSLADMCRECGHDASGCTCFPKFFKSTQETVPSVMFYSSNKDTVCERMIRHLKHRKNVQLISFLANSLAKQLRDELFRIGTTPSSCVYTYVPRKRSSVGKYGFDQGKELCMEVSKILGGQTLPLFTRIGGREQKKLNKRERTKNIKKSIILNSNLYGFPGEYKGKDLTEAIGGRTVIIIDDVITSGATLKHCASIIREKSTNIPVFVACIAKTPIESKASVE